MRQRRVKAHVDGQDMAESDVSLHGSPLLWHASSPDHGRDPWRTPPRCSLPPQISVGTLHVMPRGLDALALWGAECDAKLGMRLGGCGPLMTV